jgi:acyl carrier protein
MEGNNLVFDKVKDIIVDQLDVDEDKVKMEASITEDLGADSLDVVDLVMSLEEEFDVEIPDDQVENVKTVGDIVKFIEDNI